MRTAKFIVAALAALALLATACGGGSSGQTYEPNTEVFGSALPEFERLAPGAVDVATGQDAPFFTGTDMLTGESLTSQTDNAPLILGFYAHWCPNCQREIPNVSNWLKDNDLPEGVEFLGVSTFENQSRGNHPPARWLRDEDWPLPILADQNGEVAEAYGVSGVPFHVAVTADGKIAGRVSGEIGPEGLVDIANQLLTGQQFDVEGENVSEAP